MWEKRGQVTLFVVIAIVIVAGVALIYTFRDQLFVSSIPQEFEPIYSYYTSCVEEQTRAGISLLGTQGGRIDVGEYAPGSDYAPFSSHLNFLGVNVPYWYYVAGNGIVDENVPTEGDMERDLENFVASNVKECDFERFYNEGFYITLDDPIVNVDIKDSSVDVSVDSNLVVQRENSSFSKDNYKVNVNSGIGKLYKEAVGVYEKEQETLFLENYAVDALRLYAPVDGVEISCSPKIWKTGDVVNNLRDALSANIGAIRTRGDYYDLSSKEEDYFVVDHNAENVRFIYSKDWPSTIEVTPATQALMVADPIGNQEGLGVLGFCYTPYHFVYDVSFPVMVQVGEGTEIFQFPTAVIIDNNLPRNTTVGDFDYSLDVGENLCAYSTNPLSVRVYDTNLQPVEARVSYQCFDQSCDMGVGADVNGLVPACVNGYVVTEAEGYKTQRQLLSSNSESSADIIMDKLHPVQVKVYVDGKEVSNNSVVHFIGTEMTSSAVLPDNDNVELSEGMYNVSVYVYGDSGITIPASTKTQCTEVARSGVLGFFGQTEEKCIPITIPATKIDYALTAGGKATTYILESELENGAISVYVQSLPAPSSLEQLQYNFEIFNSLGADFSFP